jgi:hypothetical protein
MRECDDNRGDFVYHLVPWAFNTLGMVLRVCATYLLVIKNLKGFHDSLGIVNSQFQQTIPSKAWSFISTLLCAQYAGAHPH